MYYDSTYREDVEIFAFAIFFSLVIEVCIMYV